MSPASIYLALRFLFPLVGGMVAMMTDIRQQRIPNWLCVSLGVSGLVFRSGTGFSSGFLDSLAGFAVGFGVLFVLYLIGGSGAGDVKFMAAVGTWIGPYHIVFVFVLSAIVLFIYTVFVFFWRILRGWPITSPFARNSDSNQKSADRTTSKETSPFRARIPYAVPATIALAVRLVWLLFIGRTS